MTTQEVLTQVLSDNNLSVKQLSELTGYELSKLYDVSRGKTKRMPEELAKKISELFPNYDTIWLQTGNGSVTTVNVDMGDTIKNNAGATIATRDSSITQNDNQCLQSLLAEKDKQIAQLQSQIDNLTTILKNITSK